MAELLKINETDAGNFIGHVQTKEIKKTMLGNVNADKYYFVRLADNKTKIGPIKGFDLKDWDVVPSFDDDGNRFNWLEPK